MGLEKISDKLDKYFKRLDDGKAKKIKPAHVEKAIAKLSVKREALQEELLASEKASKKRRLEKKLGTVAEQIERANWLLEKIS